LVNDGAFRADLFFRLNVITIDVAPLRKRKEDIPLLTQFFLEKFNRERNKNIQISEEALQLMMGYDFYGNVRELRNIIEDAFVLCENKLITPANLSIRPLRPDKKDQSKIKDKIVPLVNLPVAYREALESFEKEYFENILEVNQWNYNLAANDAGITREWMSKKISKLRIKKM
jgi:DNA-binding NtrC family response regulator